MIFVWLGGLAVAIWGVCSLVSLDTVGDWGEFFVGFGVLLLFGAFAPPAYGAYHYLKHGEWSSISLLETINFLLGSESGIFQKTNWVGIDSLAVKYLATNVGWTIMALGFAVIYSTIYWAGQRQEREAAIAYARKLAELKGPDSE